MITQMVLFKIKDFIENADQQEELQIFKNSTKFGI